MAADYVVVERGVLERLIDTAVSYAMQTYDRSGVTGRLCDEARAALSAEAVQGHCACGGSGTIRIYEIVNGQPSIAETKPCPGIPTAPAGAEPCRRCAVLLDKPEDRSEACATCGEYTVILRCVSCKPAELLGEGPSREALMYLYEACDEAHRREYEFSTGMWEALSQCRREAAGGKPDAGCLDNAPCGAVLDEHTCQNGRGHTGAHYDPATHAEWTDVEADADA
jgi:hypothetical protein